MVPPVSPSTKEPIWSCSCVVDLPLVMVKKSISPDKDH